MKQKESEGKENNGGLQRVSSSERLARKLKVPSDNTSLHDTMDSIDHTNEPI